MVLSVFVATIIPTIEAYGVLVTNIISAGYGLLALGYVCCVYQTSSFEILTLVCLCSPEQAGISDSALR